jgi:hypothetical protein
VIAIVAVVAAVAGTACGGAVPATSPADDSSAAPIVAHAPAPVAVVQPDAAVGEGAASAAVATEPPRIAAAGAHSPGPTPGPAASASASTSSSPSTDQLSATVAPSCVVANQPFVVTIASTPQASLALAVSFADDQAHGLMTFADADDAGRFTWRLVAPPDAPSGPATVLIAARDAEGRDTGATVGFAVAGKSCG